MRVLYVDDDRINALLFEETCKLVDGIETRCADSGSEAVEVAAQWRPHLLVIDLHLPDTDGYALLARLRAQTPLHAVPAYLCTADAPELVDGAARAAGFAGCWTKPVVLDELRRELARLRPAD
jgi:CheY-like chemotaxis protein